MPLFSFRLSSGFSQTERNEALRAEDETTRKSGFSAFYQDFRKPFLYKMSRNYKLNEVDAKNLYQEAFLKMWAKSQEGIHFTVSPEAWLTQLAKGILFNQRKKIAEKNTLYVYDLAMYETTYINEDTNEKNIQRLYQLLRQSATNTCRELLEWAFLEGLNNEEIAEVMAYKNADSVKVQKSRCVEKLKNWVEKHQLTIEDFLY